MAPTAIDRAVSLQSHTNLRTTATAIDRNRARLLLEITQAAIEVWAPTGSG